MRRSKPEAEKRGRILVIDDSLSILSQVRDRLSREGYVVRTTTNAMGNAPLLRDTDLVLIDQHMPGFEGSTILAALKKSQSLDGNELPRFYLFTTDNQSVADCRALGFDGRISGKGDWDTVARQVNAIMAMINVRKKHC